MSSPTTITPTYKVTPSINEIASELRTKLKAEFPAFKFSVTISKYSGDRWMSINLMSGPTTPFQCNPRGKNEMIGQINEKSFFANDKSYANHVARINYEDVTNVLPHASAVGYYNNGNWLTEEAWDMLKTVAELASTHNWDNSDSQTDYFDVNYYILMGIGKWDKPYVITTGGK